MENTPLKIFEEYKKGCEFKSGLGSKGLFEQSKINERFYIGDQWHGAKCGNERPLVRHNIIKRIADYKISQILSSPLSLRFSADGIPSYNFKQENFDFNTFSKENKLCENEINYMMNVFSNYFKVTSERVKLNDINEQILRKAYITGSAVLYTYWDKDINTGLFADGSKTIRLKGDIACEVLDIEDIIFADPYSEDLQKQTYIIISSRQDVDDVLREARLNGADLLTLTRISECGEEGKITVLTKLYKEYIDGIGYTIKSVKVCEDAVIRDAFDTGLRLYPLAIFSWERKNNLIYGESEITYLIPNQIAINRMITANVWSAMTNGMPIMVVNGDTVTQKISNDPGQIIKVYGSNEDVVGAVNYVTPPSFAKDFDSSINALINNTLTQSGANEVALGDSKAENATALFAMRDAALMPLQIIKNRFYVFVEDIARIWTDFWVTHYGKRALKIEDKGGSKYILFNGDRYKELAVCTRVDIATASLYSEKEKTEMLINLFEKGVINRAQLLQRLPDGIVSNIEELLSTEVVDDEGI